MLRASSGWKVVSKVAYGQNTILKLILVVVFLCVQLKEIEDKILEVLSSSKVNPPSFSLAVSSSIVKSISLSG